MPTTQTDAETTYSFYTAWTHCRSLVVIAARAFRDGTGTVEDLDAYLKAEEIARREFEAALTPRK